MPYTGDDFDFELDDRLKQLRTIYRQFKVENSIPEKPQSNNFEESSSITSEDEEPTDLNESVTDETMTNNDETVTNVTENDEIEPVEDSDDEEINTEEQKIESVTNVTESQDAVKCDKCSLTFPSMQLLFSHKKSSAYINDQKHQCKICDFVSCTNKGLSIHIEREHSKDELSKEKRKFHCDKCSYICFSNSHLKDHFKTQEYKLNKKYFCDLCDYTSCTKNGVNIHKKKVIHDTNSSNQQESNQEKPNVDKSVTNHDESVINHDENVTKSVTNDDAKPDDIPKKIYKPKWFRELQQDQAQQLPQIKEVVGARSPISNQMSSEENVLSDAETVVNEDEDTNQIAKVKKESYFNANKKNKDKHGGLETSLTIRQNIKNEPLDIDDTLIEDPNNDDFEQSQEAVQAEDNNIEINLTKIKIKQEKIINPEKNQIEETQEEASSDDLDSHINNDIAENDELFQNNSIKKEPNSKESNPPPLKCSFCEVSFKKSKYLKAHLKKFHENAEEDAEENVEENVEENTDEQEVSDQLCQCDKCDFETKSSDEMEKHKTSERYLSDSLFGCKKCSQQFCTRKSVQQHIVRYVLNIFLKLFAIAILKV